MFTIIMALSLLMADKPPQAPTKPAQPAAACNCSVTGVCTCATGACACPNGVGAAGGGDALIVMERRKPIRRILGIFFHRRHGGCATYGG